MQKKKIITSTNLSHNYVTKNKPVTNLSCWLIIMPTEITK